jgi:hypothetical protein
VITAAAAAATTAATQLIRYELEPTHTMPAAPRPRVPRPARSRRPAGTGQPSRAVTAALLVLTLALLAAIFAAGNLMT